MEGNVLLAFQEFFNHYKCERSFATFVTLIPKKQGATNMRDVFPISLIGSVYKLISKVLVKCIKFVIGI